MSPPPNPSVDSDGHAAPAAAGERLGVLYEKHGRMVLGLCRLIVHDPHDAEDAAQQTFLSAYSAMLKGTNPRDPAAWLGTIARNECRSRARARASAPAPFPDDVPSESDACDAASQREDVRAVLLALSELSERQRDALVLRSVYGLSYRDVAKALGTSVATVEALIFRGRRRLSAAARPQIAAAHVLLVLPATLRGDLARLIPGFEAGAAAAGVAGVGTAATGLGLAAAGGGTASGTVGLFGAPIAAKVVVAVTAVAIGIGAGPQIVGFKPHTPSTSAVPAGPTAASGETNARTRTAPTLRARRATMRLGAVAGTPTHPRAWRLQPAASPSAAAAPAVTSLDVAAAGTDGADHRPTRVPTTSDRRSDDGRHHVGASPAGEADDAGGAETTGASRQTEAERHGESESGGDRARTDASTTADSPGSDDPESVTTEAVAP